MKKTDKFAEVANTKSIDEQVAKRIRRFLLRWLREWVPESNPKGFHGLRAAELLKLSPGYLSELTNPNSNKSPGLDVVLRLREKSGASFEDITGHRAPPTPRYPLPRLPPDAHIAEAAAEEASSRAPDERETTRPAGVGPTRKRHSP